MIILFRLKHIIIKFETVMKYAVLSKTGSLVEIIWMALSTLKSCFNA